MSGMQYYPGKRYFKSAVTGIVAKASGDAETSRLFEAIGAVTPTETVDIEAVTVLNELIGLSARARILRNLTRIIRSDQLSFIQPIATKMTGTEKVEPMVEAPLNSNAYSKATFSFWKNVVHVVIADESSKRAAVDIMGASIRDAARDIARMENKQIDEAIDAGITAGGGDVTSATAGAWDTVTNNPFEDIIVAQNWIEGENEFRMNFLAAHPLVWNDFFSNNFVKGQLSGVDQRGAGTMFPVPNMPGVTGLSDWALKNTSMFYFATEAPALILGKGPMEAARYRNEAAGYDAYITRDFLQPQAVLTTAMFETTAVRS